MNIEKYVVIIPGITKKMIYGVNGYRKAALTLIEILKDKSQEIPNTFILIEDDNKCLYKILYRDGVIFDIKKCEKCDLEFSCEMYSTIRFCSDRCRKGITRLPISDDQFLEEVQNSSIAAAARKYKIPYGKACWWTHSIEHKKHRKQLIKEGKIK